MHTIQVDGYAQRLYFLDPRDSWDRLQRDNHSTSASRWHKNDLHRLDVIQAQVIWAGQVSDMLYFFYTRPTVRRWDNQIGVIRKLYHWIARCVWAKVWACDDIRSWPSCQTLDDASWDCDELAFYSSLTSDARGKIFVEFSYFFYKYCKILCLFLWRFTNIFNVPFI